eukprot:15334370-Ditylum_brightwellii.AAC.1
MTMTVGRSQGSSEFSVYSSYYNIHGGIIYSDLGPTSSPSAYPTASPSLSSAPSISHAPTTEWSEIRSAHASMCSSCYSGFGNQFEILALHDMKIEGLDIQMRTSSSQNIFVYTRSDTYSENSRHNNFDGGWTMIQNVNVAGNHPSLTSLPNFDVPITLWAGEKLSFTVALKHKRSMGFLKGTNNYNTPTDASTDDLIVYEGSSVTNYYDGNVQSAYTRSSYTYIFTGGIRYQIRNAGNSIDNPHVGGTAASVSGTVGDDGDDYGVCQPGECEDNEDEDVVESS